MTLNEMILELFDNLGRPTDVCPLDTLSDNTTINPALPGYIQLRNWINQGYKAITTWRTPNGRFYRHNDMIDRRYIQWGPRALTHSMNLSDPDADKGYTQDVHQIVFPSDTYYETYTPPAMVLVGIVGLGDDLEYQEVTPATLPYQSVDAGLQYSQVYQQVLGADWASLAYFTDSHTLYTLAPLPWVTPESVITVYERGISWKRFAIQHDVLDLYAIRSLRVIDKGHDMELASRTDNFTNNLSQVGTPNEYWREGEYLYFDRHVDQEYTLQLEYYREPYPLLTGDQVPEIPERYHTPIVYWATYRGLLRAGENQDAYSMRGFLDQEMRSIIKETDLDIDRLEGNFRAGFSSGGYN